MSISTNPGRPVDGVASGRFERWSERMLKRGLQKLSSGSITLVDRDGREVFGDSAGPAPHAVVTVHDSRFYSDTVIGGSIGAAEAFMRGYWSCDDLTSLLRVLLINSSVSEGIQARAAQALERPLLKCMHALRRNSQRGSRENIAAHYDLGNDLFQLFLDETMMYSCALFSRDDSTLAEAQTVKIDRICQKLQLQTDDHVMEIGTGWGGFAIHAASRYRCRVTTTTISREQFDLASERVRSAGLADRITVIQKDYRNLTGIYDKLVSIEMIEAVGHEFLGEYFSKCSQLLKPEGQMLIQAITMLDQAYDEYLRNVDFIQRYIFPGGCLPSMSGMTLAIKRKTDLQFFNLEDLTPHYAHTLQCWRDRFLQRLDQVQTLGYPASFIRMFEFYFSYCEAAFLERRTQLVQLMFVKPKCRRQSFVPLLDTRPAVQE